jgi:hypothetical protein
MRWLLVLALVHGLVPGLGEVAEAVVHYAVEGHLAHSDADRGDLGELGHEHGCGTTEHHCACCASQAFVAHPGDAGVALVPAHERTFDERAQLASLHTPAPLRRPPITS